MNTLAKVIVATSLAFGALGAQAGQDNYPGDFAKPAASNPAPVLGQLSYPSIYTQGFVAEPMKSQAAGRSVAEVRAEIPKQRMANVLSVGA